MRTVKRKQSKRKKLLKWIGALAVLCIVLLTVNFVMNKSMSTTTYHITHAKINDSLDGLRSYSLAIYTPSAMNGQESTLQKR